MTQSEGCGGRAVSPAPTDVPSRRQRYRCTLHQHDDPTTFSSLRRRKHMLPVRHILPSQAREVNSCPGLLHPCTRRRTASPPLDRTTLAARTTMRVVRPSADESTRKRESCASAALGCTSKTIVSSTGRPGRPQGCAAASPPRATVSLKTAETPATWLVWRNAALVWI